MISEVRKAL